MERVVNKCCRICWNTSYWREPTGEAAILEGGKAYVRSHGFGHEEWLFNFSWVQPGPKTSPGSFKYGFLQPIGKFRNKYQGQTFNVFLYTVAPNSERVAVGIIRNLYVPQDDELASAYQYMKRRGWIDEMKQDLATLGISTNLEIDGPSSVINVRFRQSDVQFFEPRYILPRSHVSYRIGRYQPLNWKSPAKPTQRISKGRKSLEDGKKRSEAERTRAAVEGVVYSPHHVRLQNALYDYLRDRFGKRMVHYEQEYIDLQMLRGSIKTLFEIKIASTAKKCIRQAIGQLLEYDLYPNRRCKSQLIVVGEERATPNDELYLHELRKRFRIPISYHRWDWDRSELEGNL